MTAPSDSEGSAERDEDQEILLRLGDILPRVPEHLLKPGPHNTTAHVRFSVDELAEKIARGRVSVSVERLAAVCPEIFCDGAAFSGEEEIQLPLQKLLEQVGLVAPKTPAVNGIPPEQIEQARTQAARIIEVASTLPTTDPKPSSPISPTVSKENATDAPSPQPAGIAKALSTARHIFGFFGRASDSSAQGAAAEKAKEEKPPSKEKKSTSKSQGILPGADSAALPKPKAAPETVPAGFISLRALPIFRLLPAEAFRHGRLPSDEARVLLPLAVVDPQLAGGHVEIPIEDFIKALPEDLRGTLNPVQNLPVWIPLDEIFQNLPPDHLFYMPPLGAPAEDTPAGQEFAPVESVAEQKEKPSAESEPVAPVDLLHEPKSEPGPVQPVLQPVSPAEEITPREESAPEAPIANESPAPVSSEVAPPVEEPKALPVQAEISSAESQPVELASSRAPSAPEAAPSNEETEATAPQPEPAAERALAASLALDPTPEPQSAVPQVVVEAEPPSPAPEAEPAIAAPEPPKKAPEAVLPTPATVVSGAEKPTPVPVVPPEQAAAEAISPPPEPAPAAPPPAPPADPSTSAQEPASRAPWMRGFQVPPPRLFTGGSPATDAPPEAVPIVEAPPLAATPEAKRTADFLASQPGVFAAAAFVQGAVFASADFPRKPDLDALRDFMGSFVDHARESGIRLGWNRVLTIACEQFHATAVVREAHFIVALHHDRVLSSVAHDALTTAANDLSKAAPQG